MNLFKFCRALRAGKLDEQIQDLEQLANQQLSYTNPLKLETQTQQHRSGQHNIAVVTMLKDLKQKLEPFDTPPSTVRLPNGRIKRI